MPGKDPAKGARDTGRSDRGLGKGPADRDRQGNRGNNPGNPNARNYLDYDDQTTTMPNGSRVPVGKMRTDYMDYTNPSIADKIGGFFSGFGGFAEKNPFKDSSYGLPDAAGNPTAGQGARWGWDPVQAAVTIGGAFTPAPVGLGYRALRYGYEALTDKPWPTVDMGPSVFGGSYPGGIGQASSGGGMFGGGGSPSSQQDNRGAQGPQSGILGLSGQIPTPAAPPMTTPASPPQPQQYPLGLSNMNVPGQFKPVGGPSPYGVNLPSWSYQYR